MTGVPEVVSIVARRAEAVGRYPREGLRIAKVFRLVGDIAVEGSIMAGGTGMDDLLMTLASEAVAWVAWRRLQREQGLLAAPPGLGMIEGPQL